MPQTQTRKLPARSICDFIAAYSGPPEQFRQRLASHAGVSLRTVESRLPELVEAGILGVSREGKVKLYEKLADLTQRRYGKQRLEPHTEVGKVWLEFNRLAVREPDRATVLLAKYMPPDVPDSLKKINACDMLREMIHPPKKVVEDLTDVLPKEVVIAWKAKLDARLAELL